MVVFYVGTFGLVFELIVVMFEVVIVELVTRVFVVVDLNCWLVVVRDLDGYRV